MKNLLPTLFFFTAFFHQGCAQVKEMPAYDLAKGADVSENAFKAVRFIAGDFTKMEVDVLDNIFVLTNGNARLKKYNSKGDSVGVFNEVKQYGNPSVIDVSNPLKILVYYKNYATVAILDRLLTFRNSINFRKQNIFSVKALSTSYDNNIWIFDDQDLKIKKIKDDGTVLSESNDLRQILPEVPSVNVILDQNNFLYLYDPELGFYVFDYYGGYKNKLPFLHWSDIAISGDILYGFENNILNAYNLITKRLSTSNLSASFMPYKDIIAVNGKLYILKADGVHIFDIR